MFYFSNIVDQMLVVIFSFNPRIFYVNIALIFIKIVIVAMNKVVYRIIIFLQEYCFGIFYYLFWGFRVKLYVLQSFLSLKTILF